MSRDTNVSFFFQARLAQRVDQDDNIYGKERFLAGLWVGLDFGRMRNGRRTVLDCLVMLSTIHDDGLGLALA